MKVNRIVLRTVFLSACLIGLAAAFKVGTVGILSSSFTDDVGWTGVIVAWLSQLNTGAIFLVSALISMLQHGSTVRQPPLPRWIPALRICSRAPFCFWCWPRIS